MKTLKDKRENNTSVGGPDLGNVYWEKDIKQAIKDLKEEMWNDVDFSFGSAILAVNKIFGVWEEINSEKTT